MYTKGALRRVLLSSCCFAVAALATPAGAATYTVATGTTQVVDTQITGADNVLLTGGGTLVLTNKANTYTGGTQVTGASLLQIDNDAQLGAGNFTLGSGTTAGQLVFAGETTLRASRTVTLNAGSETINTGTFTDTIASVIAGSGTLVKTGSGTLILTGANTYTGGTTVSAGSLQIGSGGTSGSLASASVSISSSATLVFNRSDNISYSGVMSGSGALTQAGTGTLTLTGANSLTGATTVASGTLALSGAGALTSSALTVNGNFDISAITATSATIKSLAGSGYVILGNNKSLVTTSGALFNGVISGNGGLTVNGGTEILAGKNVYTGTTVIGSSGTLQIGNLDSTGWISSTAITDNGTLSFGRMDNVTYAGVISGTGAVKQIGLGVLTLNAGNTYTGLTTVSAGTLAVGDASHATAKLAGAVSVVAGANLTGYGTIGGAVTNAGTVQVGGSGVGTLTVGSYSQTGNLTVEISPTAASLLSVNGAASLGGTFTAIFDKGTYSQAVFPIIKAASVKGTFSASSGVSGDVAYGLVYPASATEVDIVVVSRSVGQVYGDLVTTGLDNARNLSDIAVDHAAFDRCGAATDCATWTSWGQIIGGTDHVAAGGGAAGFNAHSYGFMGGVGYHFSDAVALNAAVGYTTGRTTVSDKTAAADTDGYYASATLHAAGRLVAVEVGGFYMSNTSDVTRLSGSNATITSTLHSTIIGLTAEVSHSFFGGDVIPLARITTADISYGPFAETGGDVYNLTGKHGTTSNTMADIGVRLGHVFRLSDNATLRPHLFAGAQYDPWLSSPNIAMGLSSALNSAFLGITSPTDKLSAVVRIGVDAKLRQAWAIQASFDGRHSEKHDQATFNLGASYRF